MDEINFKNIRVLSSSLDLKGKYGKTITDLAKELQSGAMLKGLVVGNTPKGDIIFHTAIGKFSLPNELELARGDIITVRFAREGESLDGKIITINDTSTPEAEAVSIAFIKSNQLTKARQEDIIASRQSPGSKVSIDHPTKLPEQIKGQITYLNLSKLSKNSLLYKTLANISSDENKVHNTTLKLVPLASKFTSPLQFKGEVSDITKDGRQLIKTDFGIISATNTKIPVGQRMTLELSSINDKQIDINISGQVSEFFFNLHKNWQLARHLTIPGRQTDIGNTDTEYDSREHATNAKAELANTGRLPALPESKPGSIQTARNLLAATKQTANLITQSLVDTESNKTNPATSQGRNGVAEGKTTPPKLEQGQNTPLSNLTGDINKGAIGSSAIGVKTLLPEEQEEKLRHKLRDRINSDSRNVEDRIIPNKSVKPKSLNNLLKTFSDSEAIKKLSSEYRALKELLVVNPYDEGNLNNWQPVLIPFYNGREITDHEIQIMRTSEQLLRFLINIDIEPLGELCLDGLIKFDTGSKTPKGFDLTMRSKKRLDNELQNIVAGIFKANQKITGLGGSLSFDDSGNF